MTDPISTVETATKADLDKLEAKVTAGYKADLAKTEEYFIHLVADAHSRIRAALESDEAKVKNFWSQHKAVILSGLAVLVLVAVSLKFLA